VIFLSAAVAPRRFVGAIAALLAAVLPRSASPQERAPRSIGVALSGGAAKGLAHIGVLEALEERGIRIDVVSGTSMGALVGGLYAAGYDAHTLGSIVRRVDWQSALSDQVDRRFMQPEQKLDDGRHLLSLPMRGLVPTLPERLVSGHNARQLITRLVWPVATIRDFRQLAIPFAAVATDLETGQAVVFTSGDLADAISASMAIPGVFSPATVDGRLLADGALARNLPARDARDLGADVLICSDVTEPLKTAAEMETVLDVLGQAFALLSRPSHAEERAQCDVVIEPDVEGLTASYFEAVGEWIARGRQAVEAVDERLAEFASGAALPSRPRPPIRAYVVDTIATPGLDGARARIALSRMDLAVPGPVKPDDVADALDRLRAARAYGPLAYSLERRAGTDTVRLVVRATEAAPAAFGFGIRYDQRYKASLLFSVSLHDRLGAGSIAAVDLRAGEQAELAASYFRRFGGVTPWAVSVRGGYERVPFDVYQATTRVAEGRSYLVSTSAFAGASLGTAALVGLTGSVEHARTEVAAGGADGLPNEEFLLLTGGVMAVIDTRNRRVLETSGVQLHARAEWTRDPGSGATFAQQAVRVGAAIPLSGSISLLARLETGTSSGDSLPAHRQYRLGGGVPYYLRPDWHLPLLGLRLHEQSGRAFQVVGAGAQVRLAQALHARVLWNAGAALETWTLDPGAWVHGVGVTAGAEIAGGLVGFTLATRAVEGPWRLDLDLGFPF